MNDGARKFVASLIRKVLFAGGGVWLINLVERGVLTDADVTRLIEIAVALALMACSALWTLVKTWLAKRAAE